MTNILEIVRKAKIYLPAINGERIVRAYDFAEEAHAGQKRFSGEPYITHPLSVAEIMIDFHPDEDAIIAALLHDVVEDTVKTLDDIESNFGPTVRSLCHGMVKLSKVRTKLNDPQVDNLRKLFLAMAKDFRVVLLKLCDRLHNMRTLEHVRLEKRTRIAQETLNVYAPIASRLGIYVLKSQLEDLCFQHLHPESYADIQGQLSKTGKNRERYIEAAKKILLETIRREGVNAQVDGRVKSVYSIYRKLRKKNKNSVNDIFDVFAMRIILPDIYKYGKEYVGHLYTALGVLHNNFTPLANRFKDYIAVPKVNGYRSLHTTVMGLGPKAYAQPTEVQIRTDSMHQSAEFGIAAHWMYEEGLGVPDLGERLPNSYEEAMMKNTTPLFKQQRAWISNLEQIEKELTSDQELMENLQVDVFQDRIFVLTPRGDVKDLPKGATPVDFAYTVHTEIGHHCIGAKVNGSMVTLDHELKSGEVVEIVTRKNAKPNHQWLSFVKTNHARGRIRGWFRDLDEDKHLRDGKMLLNQKLVQFGQQPLDVDLSILRHYAGKTLTTHQREDLLREIGKGAMLASTLVRKLFTLEELIGGLSAVSKTDREKGGLAPGDATKASVAENPKMLIGGQQNVPYQFVKCCDARFSDELVGYVTRGRGVSIHRKHCPVLKNTTEDRLVEVEILKDSGPLTRYPLCLMLEADDRIGLVRDVAVVIADAGVNILDIKHMIPKEKGSLHLGFTIEFENLDQLDKVLSNLEKIPSVRRAFKVNSGSI